MSIDALEVLKWVGIVLAAGFVGYFGRYLAMLIIDRMRKKKQAEPPGPPAAARPPEAASIKLAKKRAKQAAKQAKKAAKKS